MTRYLIIGNGVAGTTAADAIRKKDKEGQLTIIGDEDLPFYYRIRLNDLLCGEVTEEELMIRDRKWYRDNDINLVTGIRVVEVDGEQRYVRTDGQHQYPYDRLLLATGSHSFVPPLAGTEKTGVFTLRNVADVRSIKKYSRDRHRVVLIGGGLLGLETGNALRKAGHAVTVVEFLPRLLPRQLDRRGADRLQAILEEMGLSFRIDAKTTELGGSGEVDRVILERGESIPADLVILSAGVRPNLDLARQLGLDIRRGIVVDSSLQTSRKDIFAAGDVAEHNDTMYGIWPAAFQQGKIAGTNMAGGRAEYSGSTMMTKLKVSGIDLATAGDIDEENRYEAKIEETADAYRKFVIHDDRLAGCIMLGDTKGFSAMMRAISEKTPVSELSL